MPQTPARKTPAAACAHPAPDATPAPRQTSRRRRRARESPCACCPRGDRPCIVGAATARARQAKRRRSWLRRASARRSGAPGCASSRRAGQAGPCGGAIPPPQQQALPIVAFLQHNRPDIRRIRNLPASMVGAIRRPQPVRASGPAQGAEARGRRHTRRMRTAVFRGGPTPQAFAPRAADSPVGHWPRAANRTCGNLRRVALGAKCGILSHCHVPPPAVSLFSIDNERHRPRPEQRSSSGGGQAERMPAAIAGPRFRARTNGTK